MSGLNTMSRIKVQEIASIRVKMFTSVFFSSHGLCFLRILPNDMTKLNKKEPHILCLIDLFMQRKINIGWQAR